MKNFDGKFQKFIENYKTYEYSSLFGNVLLSEKEIERTLKYHKYNINYLNIASVISSLSYSTRKQVGCVLVKDIAIISDGYNGMPSGFPNECEDKDGNTKKEVLHAESNCLMKMLRGSGGSSNNAILYCTLSPCIDCAKLIIQASISKVVFSELYRITDGLELLYKANIKLEFYTLKD